MTRTHDDSLGPNVAEVLVPRDRLAIADAVIAAVTESIEAHRAAMAVDTDLSTVTLIVRLDRGPKPDVMFRTEARHR